MKPNPTAPAEAANAVPAELPAGTTPAAAVPNAAAPDAAGADVAAADVAAANVAAPDVAAPDVAAPDAAAPDVPAAVESAGAGGGAPARVEERGRSWWRRWARRAGITVLAMALVATLASFGYNAWTSDRAAAPAGLTFVQAGDVLTRYRQWGTGGSPVVLVHGAFESADTWSRMAPLLARDHRVYALDLTGYGYSRRIGPYTREHQAAQLLAFLQALHLDRAVLVAHSSGAAIAAEATLREPARVAGLMFLDGDALATGAGAKSPVRHLLIDPYKTSIFRLGLRSDWLIRTIYSQQCGPGCPALDRVGVDGWRRPFQQAGAERAVWAMIGEGVPGLPISRLEELRRLPMPKAVVFGAKDNVFAADSPAQTAARIGAPAPTLIPDARHLAMISAPESVAAAVEVLWKRSVDAR